MQYELSSDPVNFLVPLNFLSLQVENMGRVNYGQYIFDGKVK